MYDSICGVDCTICQLKGSCDGCKETHGNPFHDECIVASCCKNKDYEYCEKCSDITCKLKEQLISEFNELGIEDMPEVTILNPLKGSFINIEYTLQNGQVMRLLNDNKIYLGNQLCKTDSDRCYGLAGDKSYLLVCEYGNGGSDAEIIVYKKRKHT